MFIQILGLFAGAFVILGSLPQILKIIRTKSTKDISLPMYVLQNVGIAIWIVFGVLTHSLAVVVTNVIYFVFTLTILYLKIKHG